LFLADQYRLDEAADLYTSALSLVDGQQRLDVLNNLALLELKRNNLEAATDHWQKVSTCKTVMASTCLGMAVRVNSAQSPISCLIHTNTLPKFCLLHLQAVLAAPSDTRFRFALANTWRARGKYEEGLKELNELLRVSQNPEPKYLVAKVLTLQVRTGHLLYALEISAAQVKKISLSRTIPRGTFKALGLPEPEWAPVLKRATQVGSAQDMFDLALWAKGSSPQVAIQLLLTCARLDPDFHQQKTLVYILVGEVKPINS